MTGPEHYREAEQLLAHLDNIPDPHGDAAHAVDLLTAEAQVHATLALAAACATGLSHGYASYRQWQKAIDPECAAEVTRR